MKRKFDAKNFEKPPNLFTLKRIDYKERERQYQEVKKAVRGKMIAKPVECHGVICVQ